jgi:hypothetical protein
MYVSSLELNTAQFLTTVTSLLKYAQFATKIMTSVKRDHTARATVFACKINALRRMKMKIAAVKIWPNIATMGSAQLTNHVPQMEIVEGQITVKTTFVQYVEKFHIISRKVVNIVPIAILSQI